MSAPAISAPPDVRALTARLRARLAEGQAALRADYQSRADARDCLRSRTVLVDQVLQELWRELALPAGLALVAVGGYGRGELYPASDVDILILLPEEIDAGTEQRLEELVGTFWDIGLDIGHSVRTTSECLAAAQQDITVQTTLLEARLLCGHAGLYEDFAARVHAELDPLAFFKAKRLEQEQRYARYNDTPFSLEPNCKENPGGLRDLQVISWIAQAAGIGADWDCLAGHGLITRDEAAQLHRVEVFLQHTRIRLHHISARREDRLLFDHQEALAREFGFAATEAKRASEVLMQEYYLNAKLVTQLNTILLQNLGAVIFPAGPLVAYPINQRFQSVRELLDVREEGLFEREPSAILESFLIMQQRSELKGMTARTLRALWRARQLITPAFRADPRNRRLFLSLFQQKRGLVHELRRMNQYDVLGSYLPNFGRIVGQMQHDLFHVYTVDQHILQVVRNVRRFTMVEHAHEYPLLSRLITAFDRQWLIYIAALFHDIAKGRGGDHSELGVEDAREFCRDHGISGEDAELVAWLVRHHLTMSAVAQKQDLSDAEVIRRFAEVVQTERRLTALYILTHADIRGTSPKVWNGWKGKLLEDLFFATQRLLRGASPQQALGLGERQDSARGLLRYYGLRPGVEDDLWKELDTVYFLRHDAEEVTWHTRLLYYRPSPDAPVVKARLNQVGEGLQVMVYTRDQRDLFVRLCGLFARMGYSILDAKIHTTRHGYALDSFILLDPGHQVSYRDVITLLEHEVVTHLGDPAPPDQPARGRLSRQVKHFPITPEVLIRPDERGQRYIMSVTAADRPGLLFSVAQVLARHGISVETAKIATLGERVEDTFLISGAELAKEQTLLRIEQELLEKLQVA